MVRPSAPGSGNRTRSTRRASADEESASAPSSASFSSSSTAMFRRRYPRLGSSFQAKVPKLGQLQSETGYRSERLPPMRMSSEFPHLTKLEAEEDFSQLLEFENKEVMPISNSPVDGRRVESWVVEMDEPLGSRSVFSRTQHETVNPLNSEGVLLPSVPSRTDELAAKKTAIRQEQEAWIKNLSIWYDNYRQCQEKQLQHSATSRSRKSRFKRPRHVLDLPVSPALERPQKQTKSLSNTTKVSFETDEQWSLLVGLGAGQASKRLRMIKRKAMECQTFQNSEQPIWVKKLGNFGPRIRMAGDYSRLDPDASENDKNQCSWSSSFPPLHVVWNAVLISATEMKKKLSEGVPLDLSVVLKFCKHVHRLPPADFQDGHWTATQNRDLDETLNALMELAQEARKHRAKVSDLWSVEGADIDIIRKALKPIEGLKVRPDEFGDWAHELQEVVDWQSRVDQIKNEGGLGYTADHICVDADDLALLDALRQEARNSHSLESKGLLLLESKLLKANELRDRILQWQCKADAREVPFESMKVVAALVREVARLKVRFPAATELQLFFRDAEAWVERAKIAIQSRISFSEICDLIEKGRELPLDLSDLLEKLGSRRETARKWIEQLSFYLPPLGSKEMGRSSVESPKLAWMAEVRRLLREDDNMAPILHDLACEGSRIAVELDAVKLLQVELDARNWSFRALKWLPSDEDEMAASRKKGKLDDIRDHMRKAKSLREKFGRSSTQHEAKMWKLDSEVQLQNALDGADAWLITYRNLFEGDAGNSNGARKPSLTLARLRALAAQGSSLPIGLGVALSKFNRMHNQAEEWFRDHEHLLSKCNSEQSGGVSKVTMDALKSAVKDAKSITSFNLQEAIDLEQILKAIEDWFDRVRVAVAGKKLRAKGKKYTFTVEDMRNLVAEGNRLPVEVSADVANLELQIQNVTEWQTRVSENLATMEVAFVSLREAINTAYGDPESYSPLGELMTEKSGGTIISSSSGNGAMHQFYVQRFEDEVDNLLKEVCQEARKSCIATSEGDTASQVDEVARWTIRSLKMMENRREIFDPRFFGAFDRLVSEGNALATMKSTEAHLPLSPSQDGSVLWNSIVSDQLTRFGVLAREREAFVAWSKHAENVLAGNEKKYSIDKLGDLVQQGARFPCSDNETVLKITNLMERSNRWVAEARDFIDAEQKRPMHEARTLVEEGTRLGVLCDELRTLRNGLKDAKNWATKVKKCKLEPGSFQMKSVRALFDDYDRLLVSMPDEFNKLSHAMKNYCICRRPFEGSMIKCDECGDLFHTACIGMSAAKAAKTEKYTCVRCQAARVFKTSSSNIANVLRKWSTKKDLHKARQINAQKHQRKIRKEVKEIEGYRFKAGELREALQKRGVDLQCSPTETHHLQHLAAGSFPIQDVQGISSNESGENAASDQGMLGGALTTAQQQLPEISREALMTRLREVSVLLSQCETRIVLLKEAAAKQRNEEKLEDLEAASLTKWCIRVRSSVLVPTSNELASRSCPCVDGEFSPPIASILSEAETLGLMKFFDVRYVANAFKCLAWSALVMNLFTKRPKSREVEAVLILAEELDLPDEKALKMIRSMNQRATSWKNKAIRALEPTPGEKKPYDLNELRNLCSAAEDIPVAMVMESRLHATIEDKGARYCICGGPSDGRLMLSCDKCDQWFHGSCVGTSKEQSDELEEWICPPCRGIAMDVNVLQKDFNRDPEIEETLSDDEDDGCSNAPTAEGLWPPFGLLGSPRSKEILGETMSTFPEDLGPWECERSSVEPASQHPQRTPAELQGLPTVENRRKLSGVPTSVETLPISSFRERELNSSRSLVSNIVQPPLVGLANLEVAAQMAVGIGSAPTIADSGDHVNSRTKGNFNLRETSLIGTDVAQSLGAAGVGRINQSGPVKTANGSGEVTLISGSRERMCEQVAQLIAMRSSM